MPKYIKQSMITKIVFNYKKNINNFLALRHKNAVLNFTKIKK